MQTTIPQSTGATEANKQVSNALADMHAVSSKDNDKKRMTFETVEQFVSTTRDAKSTGFAPLLNQSIKIESAVGEIKKPSIRFGLRSRVQCDFQTRQDKS